MNNGASVKRLPFKRLPFKRLPFKRLPFKRLPRCARNDIEVDEDGTKGQKTHKKRPVLSKTL
ncbi:MAG: hypothetical protein ACI9N9_002687, partial [Enterobacterales bacterium]